MRLVSAAPPSPRRPTGSGRELAGLDTLEVPSLRRPAAPAADRRRRRGRRSWRSRSRLGIWQLVVLSGWKPPWLLPAPVTVFGELWHAADRPATSSRPSA